MITVKTVEGAELSAFGLDSSWALLETREDDQVTALCAVKCEGAMLYLRVLRADNAPAADLSIRGALAYGDNRGAVNCSAVKGEYDNYLKNVGFSDSEEGLSIEIAKVVHYTF